MRRFSLAALHLIRPMPANFDRAKPAGRALQSMVSAAHAAANQVRSSFGRNRWGRSAIGGATIERGDFFPVAAKRLAPALTFGARGF